jgi:hypothetical protein
LYAGGKIKKWAWSEPQKKVQHPLEERQK